MAKKRFLVIILLISYALVTVGCGQKAEQGTEANTQTPVAKPTIPAFGIVKSKEIQNITIDFPASIEKLMAEEGQRVKKGEALALLNLTDYQAQIRSKEIELKMARIKLQKSEIDAQKIENELDSAQLAYEQAAADLTKKAKLVLEGAIPQSELDDFRKLADEKEKIFNNLKLSAQSSGAQDNMLLQAEISRLENELSQLQSKLNKSYLKGSTIVANVNDGVIFELGYQTGDPLNSAKKIFSLLDLSSLVVTADVSEEFIRDVQIGANATIIPLADPGKNFTGKVTAISAKTVEKKGETIVPVEITLDPEPHTLLPGFNVDVEIAK